MKKFDIRNYAPPGYPLSYVFIPLGVWTFIYLVSSMVSLSNRITDAVVRLGWNDYYSESRYIVDPSIKMTPYNELLRGTFAGYWLLLLICVMFALHFYLRFRTTRSIYIMNRLPAGETVKRCAAIPLAFALAVLVITLVLSLTFKTTYMTGVPKECLPPDEPVRIFNGLLPRGSVKTWLPWNWWMIRYN